MNRVGAAAEKVTEVIESWLVAEVKSSSTGVNEYLNDFDEMVRRLQLGYNNDNNWAAEKCKSHSSRLPKWWQAYEDDPSNDFAAARIGFGGLMQISGAYRDQCYIRAQNYTDYLAKRESAVSIDVEEVVARQLRTHLPKSGDFRTANIDLHLLETNMERTITLGEAAVKYLCDMALFGYDIGYDNSPSASEMDHAQAIWLAFVTDSIALAAKQRGGELAAVPFLEPISITNQSGSTHYPLREPVDWPAVLAA